MEGGKLLPWVITTKGGFWAAGPSLGRRRMASKSRPPVEVGCVGGQSSAEVAEAGPAPPGTHRTEGALVRVGAAGCGCPS